MWTRRGIFLTMPPHTWELWHQIFGTFTSQSQMNHCSKDWCSNMLKMVLGIQLNDWKINIKWCLSTQMYKIKDTMNRCPIHLIIKIILVD
jgi:hypothetical protein